jgi:hypothetical protein
MHTEFPGGDTKRLRYETASDGPPATIFLEVAPDPDDRILAARWRRLPTWRKPIITHRAACAIVPRALAALNVEGELDEVIGGYLGETNPCLAIRLDRGARALELAKFLGHVCAQQSIMVTADEPLPGLERVDLVSIPCGSTTLAITSTYDSLWRTAQLRPYVTGHTTHSGTMRIMNLGKRNLLGFSIYMGRYFKDWRYQQSTAYAVCIDKRHYFEKVEPSQEVLNPTDKLVLERRDYLRWKAGSLLKAALDSEQSHRRI